MITRSKDLFINQLSAPTPPFQLRANPISKILAANAINQPCPIGLPDTFVEVVS